MLGQEARTHMQARTHTNIHPPRCCHKGEESGRVTGKGTEGLVFTLAGWAACEPHGNGELTSTPPWLTGPACLLMPSTINAVCFPACFTPAAPNDTKKFKRKMAALTRNMAGEHSLSAKGCVQHGEAGHQMSRPPTCCNSSTNEGAGMPRTSLQCNFWDCHHWQYTAFHPQRGKLLYK